MSAFTNSDVPPLVVGYWSIRGLAAPLRMMVMFRNIPLKAENFDAVDNPTHDGFDVSQWFNYKPDLKAQNPLINLPYVKDGDFIVTQSNACFLYLGRKLRMLGNNEKELSQCEQLLMEAMDLRDMIVEFSYPEHSNEEIKKWWENNLLKEGKSLSKLAHWLNQKYSETPTPETIYFVGNEVSAPDFHIWELLDQIWGMYEFYSKLDLEDPFIRYPRLRAFHQFFKSLPQNGKYFMSALSQLPSNNCMAKTYGATPEGGLYSPGQPAPWRNSSGFY